MNSNAKKISIEMKKAMSELYGQRLEKLILFGSYARGDFHEESDLDFAIVLNDSTVSATSEILKITHFTSQLGIKHGKVISALPVSSQRLNQSQLPVYQDIRNEGIIL